MIILINFNEKTLEEIKINENNCINCKKCYNSCPMMSKYSSSPKELMKKIITDKGVDKNIPYSCSSCEVCNLKCPKDIKIKEMFYDMRKDIFNNDFIRLIVFRLYFQSLFQIKVLRNYSFQDAVYQVIARK